VQLHSLSVKLFSCGSRLVVKLRSEEIQTSRLHCIMSGSGCPKKETSTVAVQERAPVMFGSVALCDPCGGDNTARSPTDATVNDGVSAEGPTLEGGFCKTCREWNRWRRSGHCCLQCRQTGGARHGRWCASHAGAESFAWQAVPWFKAHGYPDGCTPPAGSERMVVGSECS